MSLNRTYRCFPSWLCLLVVLVIGCRPSVTQVKEAADRDALRLVVLGIAQDAGYPQAACGKACCRAVWSDEEAARRVSCLGVVDPATGQAWLFDATPDFREQWHALNEALPGDRLDQPSGIFLTHAHYGHYAGLLQLGREVMGARQVPVYVMPRLDTFLRTNGPWSQLVELNNIELRPLRADATITLSDQLRITPIQVPHRDEYSETVGYRIEGPTKRILFIPDIDKWERWERSLAAEIAAVDYAYLDATFYADGELPGRDMSKIPHPFVTETMNLLADLPAAERRKVRFIHLNHTNPLLRADDPAHEELRGRGFGLAYEGETLGL